MSYSAPNIDVKCIAAQSFKKLLNRIKANGLNETKIAEQANISLSDIEQDLPGTFRNRIDLLRAIENHDIPADFYLQTSKEFKISNFGLMGFAMISNKDLCSPLQFGATYHPITGTMLEIKLVDDEQSQQVFFELDCLFDLDSDLYRNVHEETLATFPPLLECLCGHRVETASLDLVYPEPPHAHLYEDVFGVKPKFNADTTRFGIDRGAMDLPVVSSDPDAAILLENSCQIILPEFTEENSFINSVRKNILGTLGNVMSREELASSLNVSKRTLTRRLASQNTSYIKLTNKVREQAAKDYLKRTDLAIKQVGDILGYTEPTNFRRAFLRWTGQSPKEYRQHHKR